MMRLVSEPTTCTRINEVQPAQTFHIIPLVAGLLICSFACNLSAGTPQIRLSVMAVGDNSDNAGMVSALSREFRQLDGVSVTDTQPQLTIVCTVTQSVVELEKGGRKMQTGYAAAVGVVDANNHYRLINLRVQIAGTIDGLAHVIAIALDGTEIEKLRRTAQPSSTPSSTP